ncbi:MAG: arsenate reductase ArsC [Desulfobacterales bacterium]|nr:arsenate reductase ArsC [Desulfobacterales bacterium]
MPEKINILFLCTGNSCRSQMAEGFARHIKTDLINPFSAGVETHGLNSNAVKVMAEAGVDISHHKSKNIDDFKNMKFDYVITVCSHANETCPLFPNVGKKVHVNFDDPPEMAKNFKTDIEKLDCYRKVRDQIKEFILELPDNLL